jgi:hypothetical protein
MQHPRTRGKSLTQNLIPEMFVQKKSPIQNSCRNLQSIKTQTNKSMKNNQFFLVALALILFVASSTQSIAQLQTPAASPAAFVSQNVGFTKISIDYSSPAVKGRKIFGDVVKYGSSWRAGANGQTIIEFSTAVNINGKTINAGKYSIFVTPAEKGDWTVHFNSKSASIYAYTVDGKIDETALAIDDAISVNVTPSMGENTERLAYTISAENNKVAKVTMAWEKVKISFLVDTQVDQKMEGFKSAF